MMLLAMVLALGAQAQKADYRVVPLPAHIVPANGRYPYRISGRGRHGAQR